VAGGGGDSRWLISYADLVTLLMAFFVALYGISQSDTAKFNKFLGGLGPFGNDAAVGDGVLDGSSSIVGNDQQPQTAAVAEAKLALDSGVAGTQPTYALTQGDVDSLISDLTKDLEAKGLQDAVRFRHDARGLVAAIATDQVLFETGSAEISPRGREIAAAIAPQLSRLTNDVVVEGHTDNVPLQRAGYNNWNLSTDRAVAVVRLLQESYGLHPDRLSATGYGEYRPVAGNGSAQGRAANRRVEIVIIAADAKTDATATDTTNTDTTNTDTTKTGTTNADAAKTGTAASGMAAGGPASAHR
jgi:chemotaxis protein MotB